MTPTGVHTLTLEFGRLLTEAEWRDIVERARQLPYVQHLRADYVIGPRAIPVPIDESVF